jgi:hypothetical protein
MTLEIIINFRDSDGNRQKPSANRINIPLQTEETDRTVLAVISLRMLSAVTRLFQEDKLLDPLVRDPKIQENSTGAERSMHDRFAGLVYFPYLDDIEIQEIQRSGYHTTNLS